MLAVPLVAAVVTLNTVPSLKPSASVAVRVPVTVVSSGPVPLVPPVTTVASFTAVTLKVSVLSTASYALLLSRTEKVKLAYPIPFASAAGVKTRLPAVMSATVMTWPAVTATPDRVRLPAPGNVSIRTALRLSPASTSLNPRLAVVRMCDESSLIVTVASVPVGVSLTLVRLIVNVSS